MNFLILEINEYSGEALEIYKKLGFIFTPESFEYQKIDVLITRLSKYIDRSFLNKFPQIKYILTPTTSLTHIDVNYAKEKDIKIISLRDCKDKLNIITSSAEHALTLALSLERNLHKFIKTEDLEKWDRYRYPIREISSRKIGIIGYGRIGKKLLKIFEQMSPNVVFNDLDDKYKSLKQYRDKNIMFSEIDLLLICCSYDKGDKPLISFENIKSLKKGINIVNISRAGLVNEDAIIFGLKEGIISGYATDVLIEEEENNPISKSKLISLQLRGFNILITPHIGGAAFDSMRKTELIIAQKFRSLLNELNLKI
jgi:D-3-phosphoglycerate dehydrogenase